MISSKILYYTKFLFIYLLISFGTIAQNTAYNFTEIKGQIRDADTKYPITYADLVLKNHPVGVSTNEQGYYVFKINEKYFEDTLLVSALGYQAELLPIRDILADTKLNFFLKPTTVSIDEITISDVSEKAIIKQAVENIPQNYSVSSYISRAFYQELIYENGKCNRIVEAAVKILEPGYKKSRRKRFKQKVEVEEIKRLNDLRTFRNYEWNGLQYLINENIHGQNPGGILNVYDYRDWIFNHTHNTSINNEQAFVIEFKSADENKPRPSGKMYVATTDYAILRMEWNLGDVVKNWQKIFVSDTSFLKYKNWSATFDYRRFEKRLYLTEVQHKRNFLIQQNWTKKVISEIDIENKLLVNDVITNNILEFVNLKSAPIKDSFSGNYVLNETYWEYFNLPPISEEMAIIYDEMDNRAPINFTIAEPKTNRNNILQKLIK